MVCRKIIGVVRGSVRIRMRSWASELDAPNITSLLSHSLTQGACLGLLVLLSLYLLIYKIGLIPTCKAVVRV